MSKITLSTAKEALLRLNLRQQQAGVKPRDFDNSVHTCTNCGFTFTGKLCPQCGQKAYRTRFTAKNALLSFLDTWGMGSRPMFRTIAELFIRPGYMIRDYLHGRQISYFPPFKMLIFTSLLLLLACRLVDADPFRNIVEVSIAKQIEDKDLYEDTISMVSAINEFQKRYPNVNIILQYLFIVFASRIAFRKSKLNLSENFIAHIYIANQLQIVSIVIILLTQTALRPTFLPHPLPAWLTILFILYDYIQLYGMKIWSTIWRLIVTLLLIMVFQLVIIFVFGITYGVYMAATGHVAPQ